MRIFVSGRISAKESVRSAVAELEKLGFSITHDWTRIDDSVDENSDQEVAGACAAMDIRGVIESDLYILMGDTELAGKGMHAELGAALAVHQLCGKPEIYIVGPTERISIFYMHPAVNHIESVDHLLSHLDLRAESDATAGVRRGLLVGHSNPHTGRQ